MIEDDELEDFTNPIELKAHGVKIRDVRVCIFEEEKEFPNIGLQRINLFLFSYPYINEDGGLLTAYNPIAYVGARNKECPTKELLNKGFNAIKAKTLIKNPNLTIIWDGGILTDTKIKKEHS